MDDCVNMAPSEAEKSVPARQELDLCVENTPNEHNDPKELSADLRSEMAPTAASGSVPAEQASNILIQSIERSASQEHQMTNDETVENASTTSGLQTVPGTESCSPTQQEQSSTSKPIAVDRTTTKKQLHASPTELSTSVARHSNIADVPTEVHPLHCTWTMWYLEQERHKCWEDQQHEITTLNTVEDFWRLFMKVSPPSQLKYGCDYSLFRKGIRPMWEDTANKEGGRWKIAFHGNNKFDLDAVWLDVCLILIGETLENPEKACGAVVNVRGKINKIAVWTSKSHNWGDLLRMGHQLRQTLRLQHGTLRYELHKDSMGKQGSNLIEAIYTV